MEKWNEDLDEEKPSALSHEERTRWSELCHSSLLTAAEMAERDALEERMRA